MPIALPGNTGADSVYTTTLEGQGYDIRLRWNSRSESWYLYIGLVGAQPALKTRVVTNKNLLENYSGREGLPPGKLYLFDTEKTYGRVSYDNLGSNQRFKLVYVRSTEEDPLLSIGGV